MVWLIHCKSYRYGFLLCIVTMLFLQGCATTKPLPTDPLAYKDRTKSSGNEPVTVTVAVPTIAEAQAIYGVDLASKEIQPVWLEVKNKSANIYWFLPSGLDPEYFSPSEAAFPFYTNIEKNNKQLDDKFRELHFKFRGKMVYIGQISRDIGVKFTLKSPTISTHIIDPDVDEARRYFVEDLAYSQALSRLDFVKGVGTVTKDAPQMNLVGDPFYTDGLRAVLFFEPRPNTLSDIIMPKWEIPPSLSSLMNDHTAGEEETVSSNDSLVKKRAITEEDHGIRASTAVVGDKEAKEIFGIDLAKKGIQAVWLEIENNSNRSLLLLPTAIDQDYFAPLEVALAYHKSLSTKSNKALDERILELNFPIRNSILPGSTASGYIFTNWFKGMKVIDVDLLGQHFSHNFTFFAPNPDTSIGSDLIDRIETMFSASELKNIVHEDELRDALAQLPCCVADEKGNPTGEPMNVVLIGAFDDWITAFSRRGYRLHALTPRYAFGREPDLTARKQNRGYTQAQSHTIRLWQLPIRYSGLPAWAAQVSSRLGGRFSDRLPSEKTLPLNPRVDEDRIDLMQDLAYSQAVTKIGHVKGAGRSQSTQTGVLHKDILYSTDGLRVVMQFDARPASLDEIDFYNWERLMD